MPTTTGGRSLVLVFVVVTFVFGGLLSSVLADKASLSTLSTIHAGDAVAASRMQPSEQGGSGRGGGRRTDSTESGRGRMDQIIFTTFDGALHGVSAATGATLWSVKTGGPLVTSSTPGWTEAALIPSMDGHLYTFSPEGGIERMAMTAQDLVHVSPFLDNEGTMYTGTKKVDFFSVDAAYGFSHLDDPGSMPIDMECSANTPDCIFHVVRSEYRVRALDPLTMSERWNMTVASLMPTLLLGTEEKTTDGPALLVHPDGSVSRLSPTGEPLWVWAGSRAAVVDVFYMDSGVKTLRRLATVNERNVLCTKNLEECYVAASVSGLTSEATVHVTETEGQVAVVPIPYFRRDSRVHFVGDLPLLPWGQGLSQASSSGTMVLYDQSCSPTSPSFPDCLMGIHRVTRDRWMEANAGGDDDEGYNNSRPRNRLLPPPLLIGDAEGASREREEGTITISLSVVWWSASTLLSLSSVGVAAWLKGRKSAAASGAAAAAAGGGGGGGGRDSRSTNDVSVPVVVPPKPPGSLLTAAGGGGKKKGKAKKKGKGAPEVIAVVGDTSNNNNNNSDEAGEEAAHEVDEEAEGVDEGVEVRNNEGVVDPGRPEKEPESTQRSGSGRDSSSKGKERLDINVDDDTTTTAAAAADPFLSGQGRRGGGESPSLGKLKVEKDGVLGQGSHGTVVFEGMYGERKVAVKRMLGCFYDLANNEIGLLMQSDDHPNVVRYFAKEEDEMFVYIALERCAMSLAAVVDDGNSVMALVDATGTPTKECLKLMRDIGNGLSFLHHLGMVHRDIKPQNILLSHSLTGKISDFGLCKKLESDRSSYDTQAVGTCGWMAPEALKGERCTRAVDVFSLGCVYFYMLTGGGHPFGSKFSREHMILAASPDLTPLAHMPEAVDLIGSMICHEAEKRPSIEEALRHPFFWSAQKKLTFLIDASDRIEIEAQNTRGGDRGPLVSTLESYSLRVVGPSWRAALDADLLDNLGQYRKYNYGSLRDVLRVFRNKKNHYQDLPESTQALLGELPGGFLSYFTSRFPRLLLSVWFTIREHVGEEPQFAVYFKTHEI